MLSLTVPAGQYLPDVIDYLKIHEVKIIRERQGGADGSTIISAEYDKLGSRQKNRMIKHINKGYLTAVNDSPKFEPTRIPPKIKNSLLSGFATYITSLIPLFAATSDEVPNYLTVLEDAGITNIRVFYPLITAFLPAAAASLTYFYTKPDS